MSIFIQTMCCPNIFAGRQYLWSCQLLYPSRTLLQYFAVAERHTEREVGINTLYDETVGVYEIKITLETELDALMLRALGTSKQSVSTVI